MQYAAAGALLALKRRRLRRKRRQRIYMNPVNYTRGTDSEHARLVPPLRVLDSDRFRKHFAVTPDEFDELQRYLSDSLARQPTHKYPIGVPERIQIGLR